MPFLIIFPYADFRPEEKRADQLKKCIHHLSTLIRETRAKAVMLVAEQVSPNKFNRGQLINIGIKHFLTGFGTPTHIIIHDIDILPDAAMFREYLKPRDAYSLIPFNSPIHKKIYEFKLNAGAAVYMTTVPAFRAANGFPNDFWGWGGEDDAFDARTKAAKIKIHFNSQHGTYISTDVQRQSHKSKKEYLHGQNLRNMKVYEMREVDRREWKNNGFAQIENIGYQVETETVKSGDPTLIHLRLALAPVGLHSGGSIKFNMTIFKDQWTNAAIQPNAIIRNMYKSRAVIDAQGNEIKYSSGISPQEGWHLYTLVKENNIRLALEVGMAFGTSALYICQAMADSGGKPAAEGKPAKLISVDPFQRTQWKGVGLLNVERAGLSQYHGIIEKSSTIALPALVDSGKKFDMVFVDGMHLFDYTLIDVFYACELLRVGGLVVIDDVRHKGVAKVIRYIDSNYKMIKKLKTPASTMFTYVKVADDDRAWDFHVDF